MELISSPTDLAEFNYVIDAECEGEKALLPSSILRDVAFFEALQTYCGGNIDRRFFFYIKPEIACCDDAWKNIHGYRHPNRDALLTVLFTFADAYYRRRVFRPSFVRRG